MNIVKKIVLLFFPFCLFSQIQNIEKQRIGVDWNKTSHLIFPSEISYFSSVKEFVVAEKNGNFLSIKASKKNFLTPSNLTIATKDGSFYVYDVFYKEGLKETTFDVEKQAYIEPHRVFVNMNNDIHLLFPEEVNYIDFGSGVLEAEGAHNIENLVKIKAESPFSFETNVMTRTKGNEFYLFDVLYSETETNFSYSLGGATTTILNKEELTDKTRFNVAESVKERGREEWRLGQKKNKLDFSIHNVFVRENKLIFRFNINNLSYIDYDIDYLKFYIVDKKKNKKTASQDLEIFPLFVNDYSPFIKGKGKLNFIVCFEKFTIPDDKFFIIDITEKGGGRNIKYKLKNNVLINAKKL